MNAPIGQIHTNYSYPSIREVFSETELEEFHALTDIFDTSEAVEIPFKAGALLPVVENILKYAITEEGAQDFGWGPQWTRSVERTEQVDLMIQMHKPALIGDIEADARLSFTPTDHRRQHSIIGCTAASVSGALQVFAANPIDHTIAGLASMGPNILNNNYAGPNELPGRAETPEDALGRMLSPEARQHFGIPSIAAFRTVGLSLEEIQRITSAAQQRDTTVVPIFTLGIENFAKSYWHHVTVSEIAPDGVTYHDSRRSAFRGEDTCMPAERFIKLWGRGLLETYLLVGHTQAATVAEARASSVSSDQ